MQFKMKCPKFNMPNLVMAMTLSQEKFFSFLLNLFIDSGKKIVEPSVVANSGLNHPISLSTITENFEPLNPSH